MKGRPKNKQRNSNNNKKYTKNQWNKKLVLWNNKQDSQTPGKSGYNEERKEPN
jgi:hypothetical protein